MKIRTWETQQRTMWWMVALVMVGLFANACSDTMYRTKNNRIYERLDSVTAAMENLIEDGVTPAEVHALEADLAEVRARLDHVEVGIVGGR